MSSEEKIESERRWRKRFYVTGAIVFGLTIYTVFALACNFFMQAVLTIVVTAVLTFVLSKPVDWLEKKGINRGLGTIIALLLAVAFIILCFIAFIPPIVEQCIRLVGELPSYYATFEREILPNYPELQSALSQENIDAAMAELEKSLEQYGSDMAGSAVNIAVNIAGGIGYVFGIGFVSVILTMTLLTDLPQLSKDFMSIFNDDNKKAIGMISRALGDSFYGWLTMMAICGFVFGLVTAIILQLLGVPYAFVVGLFCFIAFFIPAVGPIVAAIAAALAGLCKVWWMAIIAFALTFIIATVIQSTLQPRLTESRVNINPGFALFAGMVGGIIWGPIGMLIGVPIYAAIQSIFVEYCAEYKGKDLATAESKLFMRPGAKKKDEEAKEPASE